MIQDRLLIGLIHICAVDVQSIVHTRRELCGCCCSCGSIQRASHSVVPCVCVWVAGDVICIEALTIGYGDIGPPSKVILQELESTATQLITTLSNNISRRSSVEDVISELLIIGKVRHIPSPACIVLVSATV